MRRVEGGGIPDPIPIVGETRRHAIRRWLNQHRSNPKTHKAGERDTERESEYYTLSTPTHPYTYYIHTIQFGLVGPSYPRYYLNLASWMSERCQLRSEISVAWSAITQSMPFLQSVGAAIDHRNRRSHEWRGYGWPWEGEIMLVFLPFSSKSVDTRLLEDVSDVDLWGPPWMEEGGDGAAFVLRGAPSSSLVLQF